MFPVTSRDEMRGAATDLVDVFGNENELSKIDDHDLPAIWRAIMDRLLVIPEYDEKFGRSRRPNNRQVATSFVFYVVILSTGIPFSDPEKHFNVLKNEDIRDAKLRKIKRTQALMEQALKSRNRSDDP